MKTVYISTPLKEEKFDINMIHEAILKEGVFAFIPPNSPKVRQDQGAIVDKLMIDQCDEVWVFGVIGRDCAWEIGYAHGLKKPVKFFKTKANEQILKQDWMLYTGNFEIREDFYER